MELKMTGFASPALGYEEHAIDLNKLLIHNPPATYFFRLESSDMAELGLPKGALLVVDRSKNPAQNNYVLIRHEGQFLCRLFSKSENNAAYFSNGKEIMYPSTGETEIIGVVTSSINIYGLSH